MARGRQETRVTPERGPIRPTIEGTPAGIRSAYPTLDRTRAAARGAASNLGSRPRRAPRGADPGPQHAGREGFPDP
ncbi:predicted protein [Streptomyces sp. AA4]|nr:predicted protein [Streptomyces sp. AA4]